jgi:hypothetical protein
MGLSLKKEDMVTFLEEIKEDDESFKCMLWATLYAKLPVFKGKSTVSKVMQFTLTPGVGGMINNSFCYAGITDKTLYVVAVDSYDTSRVIATFKLPFSDMEVFKINKGLMGVYKLTIDTGNQVILTLKSTSIGTNIKDQKERVVDFLAAVEPLKTN